jgi:hypothetical protein
MLQATPLPNLPPGGKEWQKIENMAYTRLISLSKQSHASNASIKANAKELRNNQTLAEKKLWKHLRRNQISGMYFRRQHPFGIYILDFIALRQIWQ